MLLVDSVCSVAPPPNGTFIPGVEDTMEFSVIFRVEDHPALVNWSSGGVRSGDINVGDHPALSNSSTDAVGTGLTYSPGVQWLASQTIVVTDYLQTTYTFTNQTVWTFTTIRLTHLI